MGRALVVRLPLFVFGHAACGLSHDSQSQNRAIVAGVVGMDFLLGERCIPCCPQGNKEYFGEEKHTSVLYPVRGSCFLTAQSLIHILGC